MKGGAEGYKESIVDKGRIGWELWEKVFLCYCSESRKFGLHNYEKSFIEQ